jgi:alkylation response protein AidB-like acyl-CoA dehydrogenase
VASTLGPDHAELRSAVRRFLAARSDEPTVRRLMETDSGYDPDTWRLMATQLGLQGLAIPERYGGSGAGLAELAVVMEEMGRALLCAPFLSAGVLAPTLLMALADQTAESELLPALAAGSLIAAVAWADPSGLDNPDAVPLRASRIAGHWELGGEARFVLDAAIADVLLAVAATPAGVSVFDVRRDAPGLRITSMAVTDQTRRLSRVRFDRTPAILIGTDGRAWPALRRTMDTAVTALAAESVGAALYLTEISAGYAKMRTQFGKAIGSFQAIKQKLADMLVGVELAKAAVYATVATADSDPERFVLEARMTAMLCAEAYVKTAYDAIQIHGGTGFTWEHPAHLYFRRAKSSETLLGSPAHHAEVAARRLGVGIAERE